MDEKIVPTKPILNIDHIPCPSDDPMVMPVEHLEARICELAGHITAATCQFLLLVADFDERGGWASWEMPSCAAWLSWKCQIAPGTAREHVRVARVLGQLPVIREEFAAARLSYAKVRALTRIATPETERDLAEMAMPMTAGQLERFARAHRQVARGEQDGRPACREPRLTWRHDESGISISVQLPPAEGALVLQSLRARVNDVEHPHDPEKGAEDGGRADKSRAELLRELDEREGNDWDGEHPPWRERTPAQDLAGAIVGICGEYLSGRAAAADNPDNYQVIIHAGTGAITGAGEPGVSAETPEVRPLAFPQSHTAYPWRSEVEDGQAVDQATLRMIACNATISTMLHDENGTVLNAGRRTRKPPTALRRAVRERDRYRCRFPGCESRRVDLHHILFWANGGETNFENLICLCKRHHHLVHDKDIIISAAGNGFAFYLADGVLISSSPPLPGGSAGAIKDCHDAEIAYHTIVPPYSGERLDLHHAIWICFHNAKVQAERREREQREQELAA
jgi:5-methylcytosine-specific restriction endonuclease McrA